MLKRLFDIALSGLGLILSSPLWALIAAAIKLEDGGPIFYRQPRVGKNCQEFTSVKFRSMVADSDVKWGVIPAQEGDPRITRVGRMLRATAMDELPQLWNIFRGDMSFVGPRPEWVELVKRFRQEIPGFDGRHAVTPGLTGIAQIYGHSELPRRQKLRYDLLYIKRQSFWLDVKLVMVSFLVTFTGKWEHRSAKLPRVLGARGAAETRRAPVSKDSRGVSVTRN
ncbi:MAG: sugar transferase [Acidobacteriia bacterium]|nr:sugar transferase [Terriglobia bacterium]